MSNIQQLLPPYGKQNNFFNRNNHSKFLNNDINDYKGSFFDRV